MRGVPSDTIVRPGDRRVAVYRLAQGDTGRTVLVCHPAPAAGTFYPDPAQTRARGVTLLSVARPGCARRGRSRYNDRAFVGLLAR